MLRLARPAVVFLACSATIGAFWIVAVGTAGGLTLAGTGSASFSAVVRPNGRATTAWFEFGLASRYREPRPSGVVYDQSTPVVHLGADFRGHLVSGTASGLVPNALYHLRLVASSSAGRVYSHGATFMTLQDPAPPTPRIGATVNLRPVSGLVLIQPPRANLVRSSGTGRLVEGRGFLPLTEPRQLPIGSQIDARAGVLRMAVAGPRPRTTSRVTITGGLFTLTQPRRGRTKGLVTLALLEGDFPGAPTYGRCHPTGSGASGRTPNRLVLQRVHARAGRRVRTSGRYSTDTVSGSGAVWDTIDRCDGTLTIVRHGTVIVHDPRRGTTVAVHAGQRHLASAA